MLSALVSQGVYTLVPFWKASYHLSQAAAALPATVMNGGQVLSMPLLGLAIDRYGERAVVAVAVVAMSLAALGTAAFASSYVVLLLFLALLGACYASVQPGGTRAIIRWFPPSQRGVVIGIRQAAIPLGTALAAVLLPMVARDHGWSTAICVAGMFAALGGVLFGALHRDHSRELSRTENVPFTLLESMSRRDRNAALRPILIAGVACAAFQFSFSTHALTFLSGRLKVDIVAAAFSFALAQSVGVVARICLPWISDRLWPGRRLRSLSWAMCLAATACLALMVLPPVAPSWLITIIFAAIGLFGVGWYSLWLVQVAELAPRGAVGRTISLAMTLNLLAISLMPPTFGLIVDLAGYSPAWLLLIALLLIAALNLRGSVLRERIFPSPPGSGLDATPGERSLSSPAPPSRA